MAAPKDVCNLEFANWRLNQVAGLGSERGGG